MIKGTKEELDKLAGTHKCPEHPDKVLTLAWHQAEGYVLRCGAGHFPEEVTRIPSLTELHNQGVELPEPIKSNVEKGIARRRQPGVGVTVAVTMGGVPAVDLETGELLSIEQVKGLVSYAYKYGLDPHRGHVMMMHGQPYIGLDGYLWYAHEQKIPYSLTGRPMTVEELNLRGYELGDLGWHSTVKRLDTGAVFEGEGFIRKSERTQMSQKRPDRLRYPVVADKPGSMAIKRADWQALRRAFPIGETTEEDKE